MMHLSASSATPTYATETTTRNRACVVSVRSNSVAASNITECPKCRSVQSSKGPTLAYARARNFAIKTGTSSAHAAFQGIVFYVKSVQSSIGATDSLCDCFSVIFLHLQSAGPVCAHAGVRPDRPEHPLLRRPGPHIQRIRKMAAISPASLRCLTRVQIRRKLGAGKRDAPCAVTMPAKGRATPSPSSIRGCRLGRSSVA
jgi:hypothetical protein